MCGNNNVNNNEQPVPAVVKNNSHCKPFTSEEQLKDAQSNLVSCVGNKQVLATQGFGNLNNVPKGVSL